MEYVYSLKESSSTAVPRRLRGEVDCVMPRQVRVPTQTVWMVKYYIINGEHNTHDAAHGRAVHNDFVAFPFL